MGEGERQRALGRWAKMTPEQRRAHGEKVRAGQLAAAAARTPEEQAEAIERRREAAVRGAATLRARGGHQFTPEQLAARGRKISETRQRKRREREAARAADAAEPTAVPAPSDHRTARQRQPNYGGTNPHARRGYRQRPETVAKRKATIAARLQQARDAGVSIRELFQAGTNPYSPGHAYAAPSVFRHLVACTLVCEECPLYSQTVANAMMPRSQYPACAEDCDRWPDKVCEDCPCREGAAMLGMEVAA